MKKFLFILFISFNSFATYAQIPTIQSDTAPTFRWDSIPFLQRKHSGVEPAGVLKSRPEPSCDPRIWEQNMVLEHNGSATSIEEFYNRCQKPLGAFAPNAISSLLAFRRIQDHLSLKPSIRRATVSLSNGEKIFGLFAIHDDQPRPFVIFVCGTGCNATDAFNQYGLMHLFEESPFNVLAIGSGSGSESVLANHRIAVTGLEEAHRVVELMKILSGPSSPVAHLVTSWHVVGGSLGGHTAYYLSILLSQNQNLSLNAPVQSVIAYCPVIDLETTVRHLDSKFIFGAQFRKLMRETSTELVHQMKEKSPISQDEINHLQKGNLADTLAKANLSSLIQSVKEENLFLPPFAGSTLLTQEDFWNLSNGFNYTDKISIPTWIVYAKDDPIVTPTANGEKLLALMKSKPNPSLHFIEQAHGAHCTNVEAYGWPTLSTLFRSIILSEQRKENSLQVHREALTLPSPVKARLDAHSTIASYEWSVAADTRVSVTIHVFHSDRKNQNFNCQNQDPTSAYNGCLDSVVLPVNLENIFARHGEKLEFASVKSDRYALTRWLNTRAILIDAQGNSILRTIHMPSEVQWYSISR